MVRASGKWPTTSSAIALDARAAGDQMVERAAFRAGVGPLLVMAAMVADELAAEAVLDQPARAVRALEAVAADAAERQRRIAAPVEEQQRLLAALEIVLHMAEQHRRQEAAARRRRPAHVDRADGRHRRVGKARRQRDASVAALLCVDAAFDRRRRRGEHDREAADAGAHHRHVAGIVEDAVLLLVGGVVLLVDDDQAELPERQEQRRARAGHDPHAAFGDLPPDALAHARRHVGMPFGGLGAEAVLEALEEGLGQRDLRQQDQHLLAGLRAPRRPLRNRPRSCPSR